MSDINAIILEFVDASINNGIAQENGNSNQANKFYSCLLYTSPSPRDA